MAPTLWLILLGALLAGYLALDGAVFGVGLLRLRLGRDEAERRLLLTAVGPYFLGNEVWIVATAGVLFGGFPALEGSLLAGFSPLIVLVVGSMILRDAGMWFRSRRDSRAWRSTWDRLMLLASAGLAAGWGLIVGNLVEGVPRGHAVPAGAALFDPYALLCGAVFVALAACHGGVFVAMRTRGQLRDRAVGAARRLVLPAGAGLMAVVAFGFVSGAVDRPVAAALIALAGLLPLWPAWRSLHAGHHGRAFVATASCVALPVVGLGVGLAPTLLPMAADGGTLAVLGWFLVAVLPVMALSQLWLWRAFRGPVGTASLQYF